jgi:hypothetical protein
MKRFVLAFLSMATVCAVVSASPAVAQETVTGAPRGTAPVTVEGYGNPSGYADRSASSSGTADALQTPDRCHVTRDFDNSEGRYTVVCGP